MAENVKESIIESKRKTIRFSNKNVESKRESEKKAYRKTEIPKLPKMFKYGEEDEENDGIRLSIPVDEKKRISRGSTIRWRDDSIVLTAPNYQPRLTTMFADVEMKRRSTIVIRPIERFLPTYQLDPKKPFDVLNVRDIVQIVVEDEMQFIGEIKPHEFDDVARKLAEKVLFHVKANDFSRYILGAAVSIVEKMYQGFAESAIGLWDMEKGDGMACYNYERWNYLISAKVFGLYLD